MRNNLGERQIIGVAAGAGEMAMERLTVSEFFGLDKIIYTADNGGEYTEKRFREEIEKWMLQSSFFKDLSMERFIKALDFACSMVLSCVTWECPSTYCDQFDEEDIQEILEHCK